MGQFLTDYVGILIPEKQYGALEHILVPKMIVSTNLRSTEKRRYPSINTVSRAHFSSCLRFRGASSPLLTAWRIFFSRHEVDEQLDYRRYIASCCQTKTGGQFYDRFPAYVGPARQVLYQIYADERERRTIDRRPAEQRGHSG